MSPLRHPDDLPEDFFTGDAPPEKTKPVGKPVIAIEVIDGNPKALQCYPLDFLGPFSFRLYREACAGAGASYDAKLKRNIIPVEHVYGLTVALLKVAFVPQLGKGTIEAAHARADAIEADQNQAKTRLEHPAASMLWPFQREGVPWLAPRKSALLGDQMRLGKTPQSLLAAPTGSGIVVICPGHLKGEWLKKGFPKWRPDIKARLVERFEWPLPGEAVIINYERLPMLAEEVEGVALLKKTETALEAVLLTIPNNITLIGDECHMCKNSKAGRTKRFRALARAVRKADGRTWGLSGTPSPNRPMDLLNVLQSFDLLKESFGSYPRFIELMSGRRDYWGKWTWGEPKPGAAEALKRVMLRRLQKDVLPDLPPAQIEDIVIELSELPLKARKADAEAREALQAAGISPEDLIAGRMGAAEKEVIFRARRILAEALTPHAIEMLKDYQDAERPVVFFSAHAAPIEALGKIKGVGLIDATVKDEDRFTVAQDFMESKYSAIAATIKTSATGLDLSRTDDVVFIDEEFTPDWFDQAVSRSIKLDKKRGSLIKRFTIPGTIFEDVRAINDAKRVNIAASVDKAAVKSVVDTTVADLRSLK